MIRMSLAVVGVAAFAAGLWALWTGRMAIVAVAGFVELILVPLLWPERATGASPHSMPRDRHFDR